jgi:mannose-6-phosphate isomerase-like protein (cupin superfamily)
MDAMIRGSWDRAGVNRFTSAGVLAAGDRPVIAVLGARVTIAVRSGETGGAIGVIDYRMPPRYAGPPAHIHPDFDEIFMVQEGSLTFRVGDERRGAGPGDTVVVPRSVAHTFANLAAEPPRFTIIITPGGFESYFEEITPLIVDGKPDSEAIGRLSGATAWSRSAPRSAKQDPHRQTNQPSPRSTPSQLTASCCAAGTYT